ncbi:MAG: hypothetical protein K6F92_00985 [Lachnospiraceae bacterium]|nr:hypothetical protein [Lachnospiraceae bacterium]
MTYSEYRNSFSDKEEFDKAFAKLSEQEVRELIDNESAGTTAKACIYQSWRSLREGKKEVLV